MLFEKPRSQGDVVTLKLNSGEEIIARFEDETSQGVKITKPMVLSMTQKGVGMMPYLFTVDPSVSIVFQYTSIAVLANTDDDFAKQYVQATTGITLA